MLVREDDGRFVVENAEVVGKNVISCEVVTGSGGKEGEETRWFVVGFYQPPSETDGATQRLVEKTLAARPPGTRLLPIGDLNANLDDPRGRQEEIILAGMRAHGFGCATKHFRPRRSKGRRGRGRSARGR